MSNILTAQSKGKLKESGVQTGLTLLAAIVGGVTGQAIGRTGFLASVPVIFAGEYFEQPYVSALGAGMASSLTAPSSVNGLGTTPPPAKKIIDLKAAESRVMNYAKLLKRAAFLGETPEGSSYTYYLSDSDIKTEEVGSLNPRMRMRQINNSPSQRRQLMSRISQQIEGLGDALAEYDDFLEGYDNVQLSDTLYKMKSNLEGIRNAIYENPEDLMGIDENNEEGFDEETIETMNGIIGMINGASMQGLNGNDEDFIENLSVKIGALEGLLGVEDDDDELEGFDDDEFDENLSGQDEFSDSTILFGFDNEDEDDLGGYEDSFDDVMEGIF